MKLATIHRAQVAFGQAVRKHRLAAGFTQETLAEKVGVHRNYIGDIERAEENVSLVNILKICHALGVTLGQLVAEMEQA